MDEITHGSDNEDLTGSGLCKSPFQSFCFTESFYENRKQEVALPAATQLLSQPQAWLQTGQLWVGVV